MRVVMRQLSDKSCGWWRDVANVSRCLPCTHNPSTLENNLTVFKKIKYIPTMWFSHSSPIYLPRRIGSCVHRNTFTQMFTAAWFESPKLEATQMSRHRRVDDQIVACSRNGIQLSNQKEIEAHGLLTHQTKWVYPKVVTLSERSQIKGYVLNGFSSLKF